MSQSTGLDLFSDMSETNDPDLNPDQTEETEDNSVSDESETDEESTNEDENSENGAENENSEETEEILSEVPEDAVSVTDFAMELTFMKNDEGNPQYGYIIPQEIYQLVRAKNNPLPHVLVKTADDNQPRVYVLRTPALAAYAERATRIATRGSSGPGRPASKRSPDELREAFTKVDGALWNLRYAESRRDMWDGKVADRQTTVDKYKKWMTEAGITDSEISDMEASVKSAFEAEEQRKVEEREAKAAEAKAAKANGNGEK